MARAAIKVALAIASAVGLSGCGTFANVWGDGGTGEREVYGGLTGSVQSAGQCALQVAHFDSFDTVLGSTILGAYWIVDAPFSAVGDTLTLPLTLPATLHKRAAEEAGVQAVKEARRNQSEAGPAKLAPAGTPRPQPTPYSVFD